MQFVSDLNKAGAKTKPFEQSFEELWDEVSISFEPEPLGAGIPPNFHECFTGKCIPYIDFDFLIKKSNDSHAKRVSQSKKIRDSYLLKLSEALKAVFPSSKAEIIFADRSGFSTKHRCQKVSLRAYVRGVGYFSCPPACGEFLKNTTLSDSSLKGMDFDAYKRRQNMGICYSTKMGDSRVLEPLTKTFERIPFDPENPDCMDLLEKTLIQNVEGEDNCLDPEGFEFQEDAPNCNLLRSQIVDSPEFAGLERVLQCAKSLMSQLEIIRVRESEGFQTIEFTKTYDECAICKRVHAGNRAYAIYYPGAPGGDKAFLKCHDGDAKDKRIELFNDEIKDMVLTLRTGMTLGDSEDSDSEFSDFGDSVLATSPEMVLLKSDHQDEDYAEYFYEKYSKEFIMFDSEIYRFKLGSHIWKKCHDDSVIYQFLGKQVYRELRKTLDESYKKISDAEDHAAIAKKLLKLRSWKTRSGIVASIKAQIVVPGGQDPFDLQENLIGFQNGIFDLFTGELRDGQPEDFVSKTTGYDWEPIDQDKRRIMMNFISKIMPQTEERDFLLRALSSGLYGETQENMFILTGEGGNGKDALVTKMFRDTIGRAYYEYSNNTVLTDKRKSDLCQGIANMHKKRAIVWSEIPKNTTLQGAVMKELTGCDEINARGLYSKKTTTLLKGSCFLLCNDIPRVDSVDGGVARRLMVIPFRSLFKKPEEIELMINTQDVYEGDKYYQSENFRSEYKSTFFHILYEYFKIFRRDGFSMKRVPRTIRDLSRQYLADSDDFLNWFTDVYEKNPESYVQLKNVWTHFKSSDLYTNLNKAEKRGMNKKKMIENVMKNPNLKPYYADRHRFYINGKQKEYKNVLIGYRFKVDENSSDSDSD